MWDTIVTVCYSVYDNPFRMGDQLSTTNCKYSDGIVVTDNRSVTVKAGRKFQSLMMEMIISTLYVTFALRVMSDFSESLPFIGLSLSDKPCGDINMPNDPDLIFWSLTERLIYWRGKMYCRTHVLCTSGCEVEISWSRKRHNIKLWVKSITGEAQTDEIPVEKLECDKFWPIVGALSVGTQPIEFKLLNKVMQSLELHDITTSVKFSSAGGKINILDGGKTISRSSKENGNSVAILSQVIREGNHYWKLEVVSDFGASIGIGLASQNFQVSEKYCRDPLKHIYHHKGLYLWRSYRGFLYRHGRQLPQPIEPLGWQNNCPVIVELNLNMNEGTLEIFKNGKSLGVAFTDIRGPVQPAVAFYASYEKEVRLLEFKSSSIFAKDVEPDAAVHIVHNENITFDPKSLKGRLMLTDDGMTLYRQREQSGNAFCLLNVTLLSGFYRWSFVIQNDQGASTCIGVAKEPISLNKTGNLYTSQDLYVLRSFQGMLYCEGQEMKKRCSEFWLSGSLIEVSFEVHSLGGILRYSINGEDQGIACTNINPPVRPIVGFYAGMEKKITLVHYEHKPQELVPFSKLKEAMNDLNTEHTDNSRKHNPLPVFIRPSEISMYSDACMVCGAEVDVIALPCKHSVLCANHLVFDKTQSCLICDLTVSGVWNILLR